MAGSGQRTGGVFRNSIKAERIAAGFKTQALLAKAAAIEPSWFVRIENGRALAAPDELDRIAKALGGIPLSRLYDEPYLQAIGAARAAQRAGAQPR